jgi:catechol 2,3-dioxygenase-like lactoylglutathione lyase family enzyme
MQVGIVPNELELSIAFYRDRLGLAYTGSVPVLEGRVLHMFDAGGGNVVKLLELAKGTPMPSESAPPGSFAEATGIRWITIDVDDLDAVVSRCAGCTWQLPVTELRPGLRIAIVEDPDGNAIEIVQRRNL